MKAIHAGLAILLAVCAVLSYLYRYPCDTQANQTAKDAIATYDPLVDLLESIEHFLSRLYIYTWIPPTPVMDDVVVKIMMELLSTLALAIKELKRG